jgi:hypothetical protein
VKTCSRCRDAKPVTEFGKRAAARDGLQSWCKPCVLEYHREQPGRNCLVDGCEHDAAPYQRLCRMHEQRQRRHGDPHKTLVAASGHRGDTPAPDPRPVVMLRLELERSRALDTSFAYAWSFAMRAALGSLAKPLRDEWREALADTRPAWQSAYYRLPAPELNPFELLQLPVDDVLVC